MLHSIRIKQTIGRKNPLSNPQTQWCVRFPKKCPLPNTDTTVNVWAVELQANWFFLTCWGQRFLKTIMCNITWDYYLFLIFWFVFSILLIKNRGPSRTCRVSFLCVVVFSLFEKPSNLTLVSFTHPRRFGFDVRIIRE